MFRRSKRWIGWAALLAVLAAASLLLPAVRPLAAPGREPHPACQPPPDPGGPGSQAPAGDPGPGGPASDPELPFAAEPPAPLPHAPYVPAAKGRVALVVDTARRQLTLLVNGFPHRTWPVAVGKSNTPSPQGLWQVVRKDKGWGKGFGTRWLGLNVPWGIYGIHGTNKPGSIGSRASGGCIRMRNRDIEELYEWVPLGTPVWIIGQPVRPGRRLVPGHTGADVLAVQKRLREKGFYNGPLDGRYGPGTEEAVRRLQREHRLPVTGTVDERVYRILGLLP
ncbi:MAG: L,D-transpeptidase family protein [Bacillota bacterium]|nr:MAG: hypothetical protein DIU70_03295 [Bacillota bacterium]